jgi:dipeptidyl-peptidase-4
MVCPFKVFAQAIVVLFITLVFASPASAGNGPCNAPRSLRADVAGIASTIEVTNRTATPVSIEPADGSGAIANSVTLAPGESRLIETYRTDAWISRDARRRCLSRFVSEQELEKWEITADGDGDYKRKDVRSFPVYVAPEFGNHDPALLERCLKVLESNVTRLEKVVPSSAWQKISGIPIWLEYEDNRSYGGTYFGSREQLAARGIALAKARSIQFVHSLATLVESPLNPVGHELAHAYHDLVLSYAYRPIWSAFEGARIDGRYNAVRDIWGRWRRAYAMENHLEFFASLSEAYFGTSHSFPFTREELKEFDPRSYKVISDAWERPPETSPWLRGMKLSGWGVRDD